MSLLSRMSAPRRTDDLSAMVTAILSNLDKSAPRELLEPLGYLPPRAMPEPLGSTARRTALGPSGLGTTSVRSLLPDGVVVPPGLDEVAHDAPVEPGPIVESKDGDPFPAVFCPGAVRDNRPLGEEVNENLVLWADEVGIYPGQLDKVRRANFGRLMMLTHPATDDPDRLLAAAKCVLAEWATDDHYLDDASLGADAATIGSRLGVSYAAIDPADLPITYALELDQAISEDPVAVAYRSAFAHLSRYASATQVARLRHELAVMYLAYNHEATWRREGRIPPVWEYLTHRHENSFLPPMVLVDPVAGYEIPSFEFADRRVRRVFCLAGTASVILNDLYSMGSETDVDFDLPKVIAHEEKCSRQVAIERTVEIHNELMHTFVAEATILSRLGSLALRRFLTDIWAWLGGSREWHATTGRYNAVSDA
jgi:2-methylisoborneol synthase